MNDDSDLEKSLVDWVIDVPASEAVFIAYGLDYSCGGKSLEYVCRQHALDPREILNKIREALAAQRASQ